MPDLQPHSEHSEPGSAAHPFLRDIAIGISDGLAVPFALAAGLSAAVGSNCTIVTAGLAAVAAGSIAMGVGGYLAVREDLGHDDEAHDLDSFAGLGLGQEAQSIIAREMARDKEEWEDFIAKYDPGIDKARPKRALISAFSIGGAYFTGGLVPLAPYFFTGTPGNGFLLSCWIAIACMFLFGYLKSKAMGQPAWAGAIRIMLTGAAAGAAAYFIAKLFSE